jgi:hypothetical protein
MSNMATYKVVTDTKTPFITYGYVVDEKLDWGEIGGISGGFRTDYSSAFGRGSDPFYIPTLWCLFKSVFIWFLE